MIQHQMPDSSSVIESTIEYIDAIIADAPEPILSLSNSEACNALIAGVIIGASRYISTRDKPPETTVRIVRRLRETAYLIAVCTVPTEREPRDEKSR